ncbi:hypothetical protein Stsp02_05980 [Streptomyces sp. NBRC 14336]|uniref:hypothetical protein n=1 Tax=Streptomyces sp. NBRC 14336 TaxID=3030992 RepID=UPI0024A54043|nr:hypothetical protein [Streptomyces sp. NBRC 14336]WBO79953.1 hypothetical protein SBE_003693 [Streptomyces sp. SBE_14.2]GLW44936.1 hypothetical protein Stsp02_05980 [Streptomyces sp. NBRC 14336]
MGEQLSDGGAAGRPSAHPGGSDLETLLAAAMRPEALDAEAERRAVAAFREARDAGVHRARTRRRDDWRPRTRRHTARSLRATLSLILASLALGGVAVAAIGTAGSSSDASDTEPARTRSHPAPAPSHSGPVTGRGPGTPGHGPADRPDTAKDTEAHCRAYARVAGNGKALKSTAWTRLTQAAGGADKVEAYCAELLGDEAEEPGEAARAEEGRGAAGRGSENGQGAQNGAGNAGGGRTTGPKN